MPANIDAVIPLRLSLTNLGIATPGRVTMRLPADVVVIDAGSAMISTTNTLTWAFDIAADAQGIFDVWVRLPAEARDINISADIHTGTAPDFVPHTTVAYALTVSDITSLADIELQLQALASQNSYYAKALYKVQSAQYYLNRNRIEDAFEALLYATDKLRRLAETTAIDIRLQLDEVIRVLAKHLPDEEHSENDGGHHYEEQGESDGDGHHD